MKYGQRQEGPHKRICWGWGTEDGREELIKGNCMGWSMEDGRKKHIKGNCMGWSTQDGGRELIKGICWGWSTGDAGKELIKGICRGWSTEDARKELIKGFCLEWNTEDSKKNPLYGYCAAEAVFCYTAENSHHLKAQVTPKNPQFQEEKISERRKARSQVTSEKSSQNYISLFGGKPARGLPTPPPPPLREPLPHISQVANFMYKIYLLESLAGEGGRSGWFAKWWHL